MNNEQLIDMIAKRVLEQLLASGLNESKGMKQATVLVVGECADRQRLSDVLGSGFALTFLTDQEGSSAADFDHVVLADLSNALLSALAMGLERGAEGCVLVESLMLGKTVHVLAEGIAYRQFRATAKPAFYNLFAEKEAQICAYGMEVVAISELAAALSGCEKQEVAAEVVPEPVSEVVYQVSPACKPAGKQVFELSQRVIDEKALRSCYELGHRRVQLTAKALITPLARDFIRTHSDLSVVRH